MGSNQSPENDFYSFVITILTHFSGVQFDIFYDFYKLFDLFVCRVHACSLRFKI